MTDKILKALEGLKTLRLTALTDGNTIKKEKISACIQLADQITALRVGAQSMPELTVRAIDSLIHLCDDNDADVRSVADESINRVIRALSETNALPVQVELYKQVKKNGPARCVRTALSKFAAIASRLRLSKGRGFASHLTPCLISLATRPEESLQETLSKSIEKIWPVLGRFAKDNETKDLMKAFIKNIGCDNAVIRRSAANALGSIVANSRKTSVFLSLALNWLIDKVVPVSSETSSHILLGTLNAVRCLIPLIDCDTDGTIFLEKQLQIYELCLHYADSADHNIVTISLETLNLLLANSSRQLKLALLQPNGITKSHIHYTRQPSRTWARSGSEISVAGSVIGGDESLLDDADVFFQSVAIPEQTSWSINRLRSLSATSPPEDPDSDGESVMSEAPPSLSLILHEPEAPRRKISEEESCLPQEEISLLPSDFEHLDVGSFTDLALPLLFCCRKLATFLLDGTPGGIRSDRSTRVSVKSIAMNCLSGVFHMCPQLFSVKLTPFSDCEQRVSDVLLLAEHTDPQLRGVVCVVVGAFIGALLTGSKGRSVAVLDDTTSPLNIQKLMDLIEKILQDKSTATSRLALSGIRICLGRLLSSDYAAISIPLLHSLPLLATNSYWLNKARLVELLCELDYLVVGNVTGDTKMQDDVINEVILLLLRDNDGKVRHAAAEGIVNMLSKLWTSSSAYAAYTERLTESMSQIFRPAQSSFTSLNLFPPYSHLQNTEPPIKSVADSLSRLVAKLTAELMVADDKYYMFGIVEALRLLSEAYPPVIYTVSWHCPRHRDAGLSVLLPLLISNITTSSYFTDLPALENATTLIANLYAGHAVCALKTSRINLSTGSHWPVFGNDELVRLSGDLLTHVLTVLNVYAQLQETPTIIRAHQGRILQMLPSKKTEKDENPNPHYAKLQKLLKNALANYKMCIDDSASESLLSVLSSTLHAMSVLLEMCLPVDSARFTDELLAYMRATVHLQPVRVLSVVLQLLKSLFVSNLPHHWVAVKEDSVVAEESIYNNCFRMPDEIILEGVKYHMASSSNKASLTPKETVIGLLPSIDRNELANNVMLFEPIVVKSLQLYTISADPNLQGLVLTLLTQLVQVKVNYFKLDAQLNFFNFVKKQFELIERGQMPGVETLLPKMFKFFVCLSYEKRDSKPIMTIPDILQMFVGLMASEQDKEKHCVPGLLPAVKDVFLPRQQVGEERKEAETHKEVLLAILLRLANHKLVLEALTYVVQSDAQVTGVIVNALLPLISNRQIKLEESATLRAVAVLLTSMPAFNSTVAVLRALFLEPPDREPDIMHMTRWLAGMTLLLKVLLCIKETTVLTHIDELVHPVDLSAIMAPSSTVADPLLVAPPSVAIPAAESLARLLLLATTRSAVVIADNPLETDAMERTLSAFFTVVLRMFQSGPFHETEAALQTLLQRSDIAVPVSDVFMQMTGVRPLLTSQYFYLLTLVGCVQHSIWVPSLTSRTSFQDKLVQRAATVALSDYLTENTWDIETLELVLSHAIILLELYNEPPVCEMLCDASVRHAQVVLDALSPMEITKPLFVDRTLQILEMIHADCSGEVAKLLITKFLRLPLVALSRRAGSLACRRLEYLLTLPHESIMSLLPPDIFREIRQTVENTFIKQKHPALVALVGKMGIEIYQEPEWSTISEKLTPVQNYQSFSEKWLFSQIIERCCGESNSDLPMGKLLLNLSLPHLQELFAQPDFHVSVLKDCFVTVKSTISNSREKILPDDVPLFIASRNALLERVRVVVGGLSGPDFVPDSVWLLAPALTSYLDILSDFSSSGVEEQDLSAIVEFSMNCLYRIAGGIASTQATPTHTVTESALSCIRSLLEHQESSVWLSRPEHRQICVSALRASVILVSSLTHQKNTRVNLESVTSSVDFLVVFLLNKKINMPDYLLKLLRRTTVLLLRLPPFWPLAMAVPEAGDVEAETLQQFSVRVGLIGWSSRAQFEEVWVALLGGFSIEHDDSSVATQGGIAALEGISVLMQGTLLAKIGDPGSFLNEHSRDLAILHECADGAPRIDDRDGFRTDLEALPANKNKHRPGLLSVEHLWSATQLAASAPDGDSPAAIGRKQISELGLDLTSCIRFLLDLYSQWTTEVHDQYYLAAALKTSLVLSDQFSDPSQFRALLDAVLQIESAMTPTELPLLPVCILVTSKCIAALLPGVAINDRLKQMMCRSDSPAVRLATVQGLLYILQSPVVYWRLQPSRHLGNSMFYVEDNEAVTQLVSTFVPIAVEILLQFVVDRCSWSELYEVHAWSLLSYLLLHYRQELGEHRDDLIELLLTSLSAQTSSSITQSLILHAVERLLLADCFDLAHTSKIGPIAENLIVLPQPSARRHGYQLLLTSSFISKRRIHTVTMDPDMLMEAIVRLGLLLNRLKRATPAEAKQVTMVLGYLLKDLQPVDVLTKLIQEFLSPQHPYTHLLAGLLFQIMENADLELLHDWVVFSLPSLVHGVNTATGIRTLTCLFVSASRDPWLRAAFPLTQTTHRPAESAADHLAVTAAAHFYSQLEQPKQKEDFREVFVTAAQTHPVYERICQAIA